MDSLQLEYCTLQYCMSYNIVTVSYRNKLHEITCHDYIHEVHTQYLADRFDLKMIFVTVLL